MNRVGETVVVPDPVRAYLDEYEFRTDDGNGLVPIGRMRVLLEDFGNGLLASLSARPAVAETGVEERRGWPTKEALETAEAMGYDLSTGQRIALLRIYTDAEFARRTSSELASLRARVAELEAGLRPFAKAAELTGKCRDNRPLWAALNSSFAQRNQFDLFVDDLRRARALLTPPQETG